MKQHAALTASLAILSLAVTVPALAQADSRPMPESTEAPSPSDASASLGVSSPQEASASLDATPSASTSVNATPSAAATESVLATSSSAVPPVAASQEPGPGFSLPKPPVPVSVDITFDGLGQGALNAGGYVSVPTNNGGQTANVPGLAQASPSVGLGGFSVGAEADLSAIALGARYQTFRVPTTTQASLITPTPPGASSTSYALPVFFPASYGDLYARLGALKVGLRNETYPSSANYTDLIAGLNFGLLNVFDVVSVNVGLLGGYGLAKPSAVTVPHVPFEGDVNLMLKLGLFQGRLGYRALGVADADLGSLVTAFTSPSSLAGNTTLQQTQFGLYQGPYLSLGVNF